MTAVPAIVSMTDLPLIEEERDSGKQRQQCQAG
jgi:hypothetical protein